MVDPRSTAAIHLAQAIEKTATWLAKREEKTIGQISNAYRDRLYNIVYDVFRTGDAIDMRRSHKALLKDMSAKAYEEGWREGGIDQAELEPEDRSAYDEAIDEFYASQREYVDSFAKDAARGRLNEAERPAILARVPLWVDSLINFGEAGKVAALGNVALTFDGDDGEESCIDCQRLKGKRHRRNWWAERGLLERNGNSNYECGRYSACHHSFYDDRGKVVIS